MCQYAGDQNDDCAAHKEYLRDLAAFDKPWHGISRSSRTAPAADMVSRMSAIADRFRRRYDAAVEKGRFGVV